MLFQSRDPYVTTPVKRGDAFRLRYGVLIYEGALDPGGIYNDYAGR